MLLTNYICHNKMNFLKFCVCVTLLYRFGYCEARGIKCGTVNRYIPLVVGGDQPDRYKWPFLAAVYSHSKYLCGGTLISTKHVLTAAHCIKKKSAERQLLPEEVFVRLGAYNLDIKNEVGVEQRNVSEIHLHPHWDAYNEKYHADITILVLSARVTYSNFIRPICLPSEATIIDDDVSGYVVGWGLTDNGTEPHTSFPRQALTNVLSDNNCYTTDLAIAHFSSNSTFCGGSAEGWPNKGDSGGAFFAVSRSAWVQFGLISVSGTNGTGHVADNPFAIYQNVKFYTDWINEIKGQAADAKILVIEEGRNEQQKGEEDGLFIAMIYHTRNEKPTYFCQGTLISTRHVLTAAHCIRGKGSSLKFLPHDTFVRLGVYNLTTKSDNLTLPPSAHLQRNVSEIYIHPDWAVYGDTYDADLAILVLSDDVINNAYIRPVYIPVTNSVLQNYTVNNDTYGDIGYVLALGMDRKIMEPNKDFTRRLAVKHFNDWYCNQFVVVQISSYRTFCGRGEEGSVGRGDGGGGFFVISGSSWVQHGIVSAMRTNATGHIDPSAVTVYQDLTFHERWIVETVGKSGGTVMGVRNAIETHQINLDCEYSDYQPYACVIHDLNVRSKNIDVNSVIGSHQPQKTAQDVNEINFRSGTLLYLPNGIGDFFKNLEHFTVKGKVGLKYIQRANFKNLEKLVDLEIGSNDIKAIDRDTLWDLRNLERFFLVYNELKTLHEKTFARNTKLRQVFLRSNKLEFLPRYLFTNNLELETVDFDDNSLIIIETDISHLNNIKRISFIDNLCIDTLYDRAESHELFHRTLQNLTELQSFLSTKCSYNIEGFIRRK